MKRKIYLIMIAFILCIGEMMAQQLPLDPKVRTGKLENGITYYLLHNNWPEGRTSFFLAQRVGSVQEEESQLGLAHFLEHMCFNGTEHFPGNAVWNFIQRNGINNNAETAFDRTLYHIDNVPSTIGEAGIDTCLLILADWAHGLTLSADEINKERDVIHGEYRMRNQAEGRILYDELPNMFPGRYGKRYPIGTMQVVDNFEHKELVDYYHRWYNPQNQAVVIVGDIDVDAYEKRIKELFSGIKSHKDAGVVEDFHIDQRDQIYFSMAKDKDMQASTLRYMINLPEMSREERNSALSISVNFAMDAAATILGYRLTDITPDANSPWLMAAAACGSMVSEKFNAFNIISVPKDGKQSEAFERMQIELRRLIQYGVTSDEYERFKQEYTQKLDNYEANKDKRDNSELATELSNFFFYGEPVLGAEMDVTIGRQLVQSFPLEGINQIISQAIASDGKNSVLCCWEKEKEGAVYVTEDELKAAFAKAQAAEIEAPADNTIKEPLMSTLPTPGKIVGEKDSKFGFKELTLNNGVKVYVRKSAVEPNTVSLNAVAHAGVQQFGIDEFANFNMAEECPVSLGGWSGRQLQKLLTGKKVSLNYSISRDNHILSGTSGSKDVETMLQLVNMDFTSMGRDDEAYDNLINQLRTVLPNIKTNTDYIFKDSVNMTLSAHDPRERQFEASDIENVNYDRVIEMLQLPMKNAANFDFIISGDFDEEQLRQLVCQYIASLPSKGKADTFKVLPENKLKKATTCDFKTPMTEPKVLSQVHWVNYDMPVTPANILNSALVSTILSNRYFKQLREEMSACYTPYANRGFNLSPVNHNIDILASHTGFSPELADAALAYTSQAIKDLAKDCSEEDLNKAKEQWLNNLREARDTKIYFYVDAMRNWLNYGYDSVSVAEDIINAQTPASIMKWLKDFQKKSVEVKIIARPE